MAIGILRHKCTIKRMQDLGSGGRRELGVVASAVPCLIVPAEQEKGINTVSIGQQHSAYFNSNVDIQVTDTIIDNRANEYTVKGIGEYLEVGNVSHIQVMVELK